MHKITRYFWPAALASYFVGFLFCLGYAAAELSASAIDGLRDTAPQVLVMVVESH